MMQHDEQTESRQLDDDLQHEQSIQEVSVSRSVMYGRTDSRKSVFCFIHLLESPRITSQGQAVSHGHGEDKLH